MATVSEKNSTNQIQPDKVPIPKNSRYIKIIPQTSSANSQKSPILIPITSVFNSQLANPTINPVNKLIVDSQGKIIKSSVSIKPKARNILKSHTKTTTVKPSAMVISSDANILRNQIKASSSQTPIIIPATTGILKSSVETSTSSSLPLTNTYPQFKVLNSKPLLIPVTNVLKSDECKKSSINSEASSPVINNLRSQITSGVTIPESVQKNIGNNSVDNNLSEANSECSKSTTSNVTDESQIKKMNDERFEKMDKLLLKQLKLNNALRKRLRVMSNQIQQLVREQNKNCKEFLTDVFTEDQIRVLELRHTNPKSVTAWSHKTLMKAIKLKKECGTQGYEELLKQNLPLPSIRTINRWCNLRNIPIP